MFFLTILLLGAIQLSSCLLPSEITYKTCPKLWKKIGCSTGVHVNLSIAIDDRNKNIVDWDNVNAYEHDLLCRCRQLNLAKGHTWFGVDSQGLCLSQRGDLGSYLIQNPLEDVSKCSGPITQATLIAPDGSNCIGSQYRPFFYTIETSVPAVLAGAPVGSAPEEEMEEEEEEVAVGAAPEKEQEEEEVASCKTVADVVLVIDVSGSVKLKGFRQTQKFIKSFMDRFDFTDGTRIGIVTYDEKCQQVLDWNESAKKNKESLKKYCDSLRYTGGSTRTDLALKCAADKIVKLQKRPNVPITCVVMTDGMTWGGSNTVHGPASSLRSLGAKIISIGVGVDIDPHELKTIAGGVENNVIITDNFSDLSGPRFLNNLIAKSCH
ncbi:uncharacterized protein LOC116289889 [Actinia tenebrosa]|uniref:Uncharacterized protein LOC116289889 n=1 Tax=Actinia tenebrosa TaxID=6105 RepID=A0A6P8HJ35_ACTTE|nr:uncharacterized protein LOC116289889 [Actinia tenebrosa]